MSFFTKITAQIKNHTPFLKGPVARPLTQEDIDNVNSYEHIPLGIPVPIPLGTPVESPIDQQSNYGNHTFNVYNAEDFASQVASPDSFKSEEMLYPLLDNTNAPVYSSDYFIPKHTNAPDDVQWQAHPETPSQPVDYSADANVQWWPQEGTHTIEHLNPAQLADYSADANVEWWSQNETNIHEQVNPQQTAGFSNNETLQGEYYNSSYFLDNPSESTYYYDNTSLEYYNNSNGFTAPVESAYYQNDNNTQFKDSEPSKDTTEYYDRWDQLTNPTGISHINLEEPNATLNPFAASADKAHNIYPQFFSETREEIAFQPDQITNMVQQSVNLNTPKYAPSDFKQNSGQTEKPLFWPDDCIASDQVLSEECFDAINKLNSESFANFHPWETNPDNKVHQAITMVVKDITSKFYDDALMNSFLDPVEANELAKKSFLNRLALAETAISEIALRSSLTPEQIEMLEIGIRDAVSLYLQAFEANALGESLQGSQPFLSYILEFAPIFLAKFSTCEGYYLSSPSSSKLFDLSTTLTQRFLSQIESEFKNNMAQKKLEIAEQIKLCTKLLNDRLKYYDSFLSLQMHLEFAARATLTRLLIQKNATHFFQMINKKQKPNENISMLILKEEVAFAEQILNFSTNGQGYSLTAEEFQTMRDEINAESIKKLVSSISNDVPSNGFLSKMKRLYKKAPKAASEDPVKKAIDEQLSFVDLLEALCDQRNRLSIALSAPLLEMKYPHEVRPVPAEDFVLKADVFKKLPSPVAAPISSSVDQVAGRVEEYVVLKPQVSYMHIAFNELLEKSDVQKDIYEQFSPEVKRDLMRHLFNIKLLGPIESRVEKIFAQRLDGEKVLHINTLYMDQLLKLNKQLESTQKELGEEILSLYYKGKQYDPDFEKKLSAFIPDSRFAEIFISIAQAAQIPTPIENSSIWATEQFRDPHYVHVTMQALECYLHVK